MPEAGYDFVPSSGDFKGARSFGERIKHAACANLAFFDEIEGKTPAAHCEKGGPSKAAGEATLIRYLRDAFDYGNRVAVWHIADHYDQIVEYLRMNGIVPPATKQYPLAVR